MRPDGNEIVWGERFVITEAASFELLVKKATSHSLALRVSVWRLFHSANFVMGSYIAA